MAFPDLEATAQEVFAALADPTRRQILAALAAGGPATATDLAAGLPITRQAIAKHLGLLAEAGLVVAEPGERRRVRYRLDSGPMKVAQQFLAALARDWDGPLAAWDALCKLEQQLREARARRRAEEPRAPSTASGARRPRGMLHTRGIE